jgi:hypothetical protein
MNKKAMKIEDRLKEIQYQFANLNKEILMESLKSSEQDLSFYQFAVKSQTRTFYSVFNVLIQTQALTIDYFNAFITEMLNITKNKKETDMKDAYHEYKKMEKTFEIDPHIIDRVTKRTVYMLKDIREGVMIDAKKTGCEKNPFFYLIQGHYHTACALLTLLSVYHTDTLDWIDNFIERISNQPNGKESEMFEALTKMREEMVEYNFGQFSDLLKE